MNHTSIELMVWLGSWMEEHCNGDWEHENQIKIETIDNPGWYIVIGLQDTALEDFSIHEEKDISENDWYFYSTEKKQFRASGDLSKLSFLLSAFRSMVEKRKLS